VSNVLKFWLTRHFYDFENDKHLVDQLNNFINKHMMATMKSPAIQLQKTLEKKVKEKEKVVTFKDDRKRKTY
jgi:hypothetical protein